MTGEVNNLCHKKAKIYEKYDKNGRSDADKQELASITKLSIVDPYFWKKVMLKQKET